MNIKVAAFTVNEKSINTCNSFLTIYVFCRCGADTAIKNNDGLTAEEVLLKERPDGWDENLHWYNKFKPGM